MSDIIVTVPRDQYDHFWGDKVPAMEAWWTMAQRPKRLQVGDSIGFVLNGAIMAAATVDRIEQRDDGRWDIVFTDCGPLAAPIPCKPFRGFRYMEVPHD